MVNRTGTHTYESRTTNTDGITVRVAIDVPEDAAWYPYGPTGSDACGTIAATAANEVLSRVDNARQEPPF